jgi:hypothetical protein
MHPSQVLGSVSVSKSFFERIRNTMSMSPLGQLPETTSGPSAAPTNTNATPATANGTAAGH